MNYDEIILEFVKELVLDCLEDDGRFPKENFDLTYIKEEISAMNFSNLREATRIDSHFLDYLDESLHIDLFIDAFVHVNGYTMNGEEILEERKKEYEKAMFKYSKKSNEIFFFEALPEPTKG